MANTIIECPRGQQTCIENVRAYVTYHGPDEAGQVVQDERWAILLPAWSDAEADALMNGPAWWQISSDQLVPIFRQGDNTNPAVDDPDYAWVHETWNLNAAGHWARIDGQA